MARPSFFTIEEAARVLRIGRTAAYAAAKRYRETDGAEGLKVIQMGGSLRVPGAWLDEMAGRPVDVESAVPPVEGLERVWPDGERKPASSKRRRLSAVTARSPHSDEQPRPPFPRAG